MTASDSGASASLRVFGAVVRALRESRGVSRKRLGTHVGYSTSQVAMVERGERIPSPAFITRAETYLDAAEVLSAPAPFLRQGSYPAQFGDYLELEAQAVGLLSYDTHTFKGLFQTEDYARAVLGARCPMLEDEEIERRVQTRMERRKLLTRRPAPTLGMVIEEPVLRRPIGGRAVLRSQLGWLLQLADLRNITVQVMPLEVEVHSGLDGPMTLIETPEGRTMVYAEGQAGSTLVTEPEEVRILAHRYGILRAQAYSTEESRKLIEKLAGEL